jgi:outer membrane protein assembly factor BamB
VYALEADTGAVRWRTELLGFDHRSPKVVDDLVLVPGAELDALGRDSGEVQWTVPLSGWVTSTDGEAFAADTGVGAVDLATGERRWYRELPADARASIPRVTDGTVVVGTSAGTVRAFDADTGDPLWQCRGDWRAIGSPSLYDGTAYVSFGDPAYFEGGSLVALDLADGTEQWKRLVDEIQTPPAVSGDVGRAGGGPYKWGPTLDVVLLGTSDEIVAYNQYGDRVWRINERPDNGLAPILADGAVYYSTSSALVGHKVSPQEGWAT